MVAFIMETDEETAAKMLWQVKAIATKEFENLPVDSKQSIFQEELLYEPAEVPSQVLDRRSRTVSIESIDIPTTHVSPLRSKKPINIIDHALVESPTIDIMEHHNWSKRVTSDLLDDDSLTIASVTDTPKRTELITQKYGKRKRESFVGLSTKKPVIRATLRKKFSWKQYPELEAFLVDNQEDYFEYSSRNYTAEQRKYNNNLTRGLLELASKEGYVFEEFTFSMVRDRIRCYYKSHSQSAKKKRRR